MSLSTSKLLDILCFDLYFLAVGTWYHFKAFQSQASNPRNRFPFYRTLANSNRFHHKIASKRALTIFYGNAVTKKWTAPQPVLFQQKDEEFFLGVGFYICPLHTWSKDQYLKPPRAVYTASCFHENVLPAVNPWPPFKLFLWRVSINCHKFSQGEYTGWLA